MAPDEEQSPVSPFSGRLNWYGWTKSEGERRARERDPGTLIVRIAYPFRSHFSPKLDLARWIVSSHRSGALPPLFSNQQITPTWVPDVTQALSRLIPQRPSGIVHIASPDVTSPVEFGRTLLEKMNEGLPPVVPGLMTSGPPPSGRAVRPLRGGLRTTRAPLLQVPLTSWKQGIDRFVRETMEGS